MAKTTTQLRQARAISLLLSGHSINQVAKEIGISEKAIDLWLREPEFKSELLANAQAIVDVTVSRLISLNEKCITALVEILDSDNDKNRIQAVRLIFEHTTKWLENDSLQRIERLETILLENEQ